MITIAPDRDSAFRPTRVGIILKNRFIVCKHVGKHDVHYYSNFSEFIGTTHND